MLTRLIIRNYAIIPELDIAIQPGLTVITGETGAGKSILLGGLGLALGKRADSKVLPDENSKCIVEAHFSLKDESLLPFFIQEGLDFDPLLICRREISSGGRSRSFVNDTPVSLRTLQDITGQLIELHHQHDNLALQSRDYQINLLDTISGSIPIKQEYTQHYQKLLSARNELARLTEVELSSARRKEFLSFQINELEQAKLISGEMTSLEETQNMLEHAEAIDHVLSHLQSVLTDGSHSLTNQLTGLIRQIESIRKVFPPISEIGDRIEAVRVEVADLAMEAGRMEGPGQKDPAKLVRVQSRLNQLYSLVKKYQCKDEGQLIELHHSLKKEMSEISTVNEQKFTVEELINDLIQQLDETGKRLSEKRINGATKLIPKVIHLLHELGMPNANFNIEVLPLSHPEHHGMDEINLLFSANKGMPLLNLQSVASGGEWDNSSDPWPKDTKY